MPKLSFYGVLNRVEVVPKEIENVWLDANRHIQPHFTEVGKGEIPRAL